MFWFSIRWFAGFLLFLSPLLFLAAAAVAWAGPHKIVLGYSAEWLDESYPPEAYNYGVLTHIARSFLEPEADGHIPVPDNYFNPALTEGAKAHGVKLIASLGGASAGDKNWLAMARNPGARERFFNELEKLVDDHGYDGIDIDWELMPQTDEDAKTFLFFMKALRARFPKKLLTTAVMAGDKWAKFIDWKELSGDVDYINVMTYDFSGDWSQYAYHHTNLYSVPGTKSDEGVSTDETIQRLEKKYGVAPGKMLLGVPFYGKYFDVEHWNDPIHPDSPKMGARYTDTVFMVQSGKFSEEWDEGAQAPYLKRKVGPGLVTYDNPKSMALKCRYVLDQKLSGVIIWVLGSDLVGDKTPLLNTIGRCFGARGKSVPPEVLARMDAVLAASVQKNWTDLADYSKRLQEKGKNKEAGEAAPGWMPDLKIPADPKQLVFHFRALQAVMAETNPKISAARHALGLKKGQ